MRKSQIIISILCLLMLPFAFSKAESGDSCSRGYTENCSSALQPAQSGTPCVDVQGTGGCGDASPLQTTPLGTQVTGSQGFVPLENIGGLYTKNNGSLSSVLNTIFDFGLGIAALLAVLMITFGGFKYMLSSTPFGKEGGRDYIESAIYGLLIILLSYVLLVTINPQIVKNNSLLGGPSTTPGTGSPTTITTQPNKTPIINGIPTSISSQAACELREDNGSYQGRRYYVASMDECQRTCSGRCTAVSADVLQSQTTNLPPPPQEPQSLFNAPQETLCTWGKGIETGKVAFSSLADCQQYCPGFGEAPRCSAIGF